MSDTVTAWLRTVVPTLWSAAVAWLLVQIPALHPLAGTLGGIGTAVLVPVVLAAWKWLWARIEPSIPAWLVQLLLGSARTPTYRPRPAAGRGPAGPASTGSSSAPAPPAAG